MLKECKNLSVYQDEIDKCTLCGNCRMVCPVFIVNKKEATSTRGRISLMHGLLNRPNIKFTPRTIEFLNQCINCQSCMKVCPPKVKYSKLLIAARADIALQKDQGFIQKFFFQKVLTSNKYTDLFYKVAGFVQRIINKKTAKNSLLGKFIYNILNFDHERVLPQIAKENFFAQKYRSRLNGVHTKRVALFIGCSARYLYPEFAQQAIEILKKNNIEVLIPKNQLCCGRPALNAGEVNSAKKNAILNLSIFNTIQDIDAIITICGSCQDVLKVEYPDLVQDAKFKLPIYDIMEFLALEKIKLNLKFPNSVVTYHHPCSQNRGGNFKEAITSTLKNSYHEKFVEAKNCEDCCGGGTLFTLRAYQTAKAISAAKLQGLTQTGADTVVCGCPHCIIRLREEAKIEKLNISIKHTIELFE